MGVFLGFYLWLIFNFILGFVILVKVGKSYEMCFLVNIKFFGLFVILDNLCVWFIIVRVDVWCNGLIIYRV